MKKFHPLRPAPNTQEDQQDREDVIPSPQLNPTMSVFDDVNLFHEETKHVLEVADCSPEPKAPQSVRKTPPWQTVPSSEIEHSELPMNLEPAPKRDQRSRRRKSDMSPSELTSSKKKKKDK